MLCICLFTVLVTTVGADQPQPRAVPWSPVSYGPDGPWPAVRLGIGTPWTQIDAYPGGVFYSLMFTPVLCGQPESSPVCDAKTAGLYESSASSTFYNISKGPRNETFHGAQSIHGNADFVFDSLLLSGEGGKQDISIANATILAASQGARTLQNGRNYSVTVGNLALGAPDRNVIFGGATGSIPIADLVGGGATPSDSFGLHIGSPSLGIPGSPDFGGYDQARVIGPSSSQQYDINTRGTFPIDLVDISIGVVPGFTSPFNFDIKPGLLALGHSSLSPSLLVGIEPMEPYLYLPDSTCRAIAAGLPLIFNAELGMYIWDIASPACDKIMSTPAAYLGFTFRFNSSISKNIDIKVPFQLLNLTLTVPLMETPTPYFPCRLPTLDTLDGPPFRLGRAFLQAAFIGVNWLSPAKAFLLAQAPGPGFAPSAIRSIQLSDAYIVNSQDDWLGTWNLGVVNTTSSSGLPASTVSVASSSSTPNANIGLVAGLSVGIGAFLVVLGLVGCWCWRRRRNRRSERPGTQIAGDQAYAGWNDQTVMHRLEEPQELEACSRSPAVLASKLALYFGSPPGELHDSTHAAGFANNHRG